MSMYGTRSDMGRRTQVVLSLVGLAVVGTALTGCSLSTAQADTASHFYAPDEMPAIWADDVSNFPYELAGGDTFPVDTPAFMTADKVVNEEGLSAITVSFFWKCSWENAYLTAASRDDSATQSKAAEELQNFGLIPAVKTWFGDLEIWRGAVAKPALAGDVNAVLADFAGSCELYADETGLAK